MLETVAWIGLSGSALSVTVAFWPVLTLLTPISATEVSTTRPVMFVMVMKPLLLELELLLDAALFEEPCPPPWPLPLDDDWVLLLDDEPLEDCCPTVSLIAVTVPAPGA